jgi:hypothetical protein
MVYADPLAQYLIWTRCNYSPNLLRLLGFIQLLACIWLSRFLVKPEKTD